MLPITRATLQSFCRVCIRELPTNAEGTREPNHDINKDQLYRMLQSVSGIIMKSTELSLYPQSICHGCYVKANAFLKFRDKAITATGVLRLLVDDNNLHESSLEKLQSYCRVCFKQRSNEAEKFYSTEKGGEVYSYMCECTGLYGEGEAAAVLVDSLKDDSRFPKHLCGRCYATLKNFVEFRAVSKQTEEYLQGLLDVSDEYRKEDTLDNEFLKSQDLLDVFERDIVVVEQLPNCHTSIKSEIRKDEENMRSTIDYDDFEMPIEVQINVPDADGLGGIDLDAVEIKKELPDDDDDDEEKPIALLKLEPTLGNPAKGKTRKLLKIKDEFEDWDSQSTETDDDDDSDFDEKKRRRKTKNKKSPAKSKKFDAAAAAATLQTTPRTRSSARTNVEPKIEPESEEEHQIVNDTSLSLSKDDAAMESIAKLPRKPKTFRTTFTCAECKKSFYKKYMYEAHIRGVHEGVEKPFSCQYCDSTFRLVQLLNRHINVRHLTELIPGINADADADDDPLSGNMRNIFICVFCQRPFRRNDHLKEHIRAVHEGLRPFHCKICGKSFGSRNTQLRHEKNHSEARPYSCEYCAKRYNSETELKVHLQRHTTNPELLCHICKRGKSTVEELRKHLAMHESSRQHQCPKCGKVFTKLFHLREHDSAVHLKLRPFKCSRCEQTFGIRKTLKTHERRHDPAGRPEFCATCDLYFKTKRALLLHMKKAHPGERRDEGEGQE